MTFVSTNITELSAGLLRAEASDTFELGNLQAWSAEFIFIVAVDIKVYFAVVLGIVQRDLTPCSLSYAALALQCMVFWGTLSSQTIKVQRAGFSINAEILKITIINCYA